MYMMQKDGTKEAEQTCFTAYLKKPGESPEHEHLVSAGRKSARW